MKIKINNVPGFTGTLDIEDDGGIPVDRFWRNRLKDAELDNCVEIIKSRARKPKEKAK